jgi:hypothetical protein
MFPILFALPISDSVLIAIASTLCVQMIESVKRAA